MGKCKIKAIPTDLGTFKHNQAYPEIIQAYSGILKNLCNPGIFIKPGYIQKLDIFRTRRIFRKLTIQNPRHI